MARINENLAVLFADITDSNKLYGALGDDAARVVVDACLSLVGEVVVRFNGRIIKTIGDEAMCVFRRADDAVAAAAEMQCVVEEQRPGNVDIKLHIGLHFGSVLSEDGDVFGDTVNSAAYLCAVAVAGQILTTEVTERNLSPGPKSRVRPVFKTVLKGSTQESTVYQVVWQKDLADLTDVNTVAQKIIPGDEGSLMVVHYDHKVRIDHARSILTAGRAADCDLVVNSKLASRKHFSIRLLRTHFYSLDHSLNGTFVTLDSGEEVHVLRGELLLEGAGRITIGASYTEGAADVITYTRARRSIYRP